MFDNLIANGFPKAGNHALVKALQLLGLPAEVAHVPFGQWPEGKSRQVMIKRDPRNIVCSMARWMGLPVSPGTYLTLFRRFVERSLVDEMGEYEGWLTDGSTLVVRYEDLVASEATIRSIAAWLGTPYIDGAFELVEGGTRTWYPDHSDWTRIWTPAVESAWDAEGGPDLLARWGYADVGGGI